MKDDEMPKAKHVNELSSKNKIQSSGIPDLFSGSYVEARERIRKQRAELYGTQSFSEFSKQILSDIASSTQTPIEVLTKKYKGIKMQHEKITIQIVNNGFHIQVGCQEFVFTSEKELFQAISEYKKDPEKAQEKYCRKGK